MPLANLVQDGVGDPADEIGRDVDAVKLGQVALDLAHRHAAGVQAQDLVVEPVEPGLAFGDKLRLEGSRPVARDRNLNFSILGQKRLRARPVAAVAASPPGGIALLVAQMLAQLGAKRPLDQSLLQLFEKPIFARQILGLPVVRKELIEKLQRYRRLRRHVSSPSRVNLTETYLHIV